ncbi:M20 aminoacylase family protein [Tatumella saanichensis]|uniref:M20 aminoacylase family protein n=1 Tax=Tatumella saanichensis TaxID=480813 RepID=UPI0004A4A605|nr:M20 aminoacylase family protein [Tatumella saanichensis]
MFDYVIPEIRENEQQMIALRRHLHANPELSLEEFETSALVAEKLIEWGYQVTRDLGKTGLVGTLKKGDSPKAIGLRADMDALPILEETGLSYQSRVAGKMHACGHDGHTTILLSAARYLASDACQFNGTVHLIFQPAEEAIGGAELMIKDGLFERFPCDAVYALHNKPGLPAGKFGFYAGHFMASADTVKITVKGKGGHGAHPYNTVDPIIAASALVMSLQSIVSRNVRPGEVAVVTVGTFHAGFASNVIPETAVMELTVRAMKPEVRDLLIQRIHEISQQTAEAYGASASLEVYESYPVLTNSEKQTAEAKALAIKLFGRDAVEDNIQPSNGSEDFAFMLEKTPGTYFLLGNDGEGKQGCSLHNPGYDFNDAIISAGASFFVRLVENHCR